jgi:hypothetical protein
MTHADPFTLRQRAQQLRREELRRATCAGTIKWASLMDSLRHRLLPVLGEARRSPARHAPFPCQSTAATHP